MCNSCCVGKSKTEFQLFFRLTEIVFLVFVHCLEVEHFYYLSMSSTLLISFLIISCSFIILFSSSVLLFCY